VLEDITVYDDTKRNDKCPCGSGSIFKKCCMREYREAKKSGDKSGAILSSHSPFEPLRDEDKKFFQKFYQDFFIFSHQYRNNSDIILIDDITDKITDFISNERVYFYKNKNKIIDSFIETKKPATQELELLENLRDAKLADYILMSCKDDTAVLMDFESNIYNVQALSSPFNEIFKHKSKYLGIETIVMPYKDYYVSDGVYSAFEIDSKIAKELDKVPLSQPAVKYSKTKDITILPLLNHFAIFCDAEDFIKMEGIILKEIPNLFAKGLLSLFDEEYLEKKYIVPAFFRSTDLANELNNEKGDRQFSIMIGGSPISSYEMGNRDEIIPYKVLEKYYQQKALVNSASESVYENIEKSKSVLFSPSISSFYTMIGMINIDKSRIDDFVDFLEKFDKPKMREKLMLGVNNLFEELSKKYKIDMFAIYLGVGIDLDSIYYEINEYRDTLGKLQISQEQTKRYSINKGK